MTAAFCPGREVLEAEEFRHAVPYIRQVRDVKCRGPKADIERRIGGKDEAESGYGTKETAEK